MSNAALIRRLLGLVLERPRLLFLLPQGGWRHRRAQWYRRWPFLPLPSRKLLEWRLFTAFGSVDAVPTAEQLESYLRWARAMNRL